MNFNLLNQVLRSEIFLHRGEQLLAVHVILGFKLISTCFQVSKHVIKAKGSRLILVDMAVEGFIWKSPFAGTELAKLPTLQETQTLVEEVTFSDDEVDAHSKEIEEDTKEESIESLVCDEDFEIFYH